MRSAVILPPLRGRGIGSALVAQLENEAASGFFDRLGYAKCNRAVVPQKIRDTRQYEALCPANADVLVKRLPG